VEHAVKVKAVAFARYKTLLGFSEIELPLPNPPSLGELLKHPCFSALPEGALLAVNQKFASHDAAISPGDEVALMPPVSGG
jgi:molybdopterin converting factor small subunit